MLTEPEPAQYEDTSIINDTWWEAGPGYRFCIGPQGLLFVNKAHGDGKAMLLWSLYGFAQKLRTP